MVTSPKQTNQKVNLRIKSNEPKKKTQELFSLSSGRTVYGVFNGGKMSTVGGAPLLHMVEQSSRYVEAVSACIKDWRMPHLIKYSIYQQVWQRVLLICAGFADTIDSNYLRHDPAIKLAMGIDLQESKHLASQPTICRLENNLDSKDCYRMAMCMLWLYIARKKKPPKEIILDFDGSCVPAYGDQQGTSYRKYWDTNMYFPLFVYDQDGWLICAILRPGWDGEARLTVPVLKRLVKGLREAWCQVRIIVRMDAAFGSPEIYDWCEDQGKDNPKKTVHYIVCLRSSADGTGVSGGFKKYRDQAKRHFGKKCGRAEYLEEGSKTKNQVLKEARAIPDKKKRKKALERLKNRVVRVFGNGYYQAGKGGKDPNGWRCERRVVSVITHDDWGCVSRYFVTNLPERYSPQYLIEQLYSARGAMELRIKEYKGLEGDKLSCQDFTANQARVMFHALAYNTLYQLREHLPGPRQEWTFKSIQNYLIRMAVRITQSTQRIVMHWASDFPWQREFWSCHKRLTAARMLC
jgi:hypothetical protein